MSRYRLTRQADQDLLEIWEYIARDNSPAADRQIDRFLDVFQVMAASPSFGQHHPELGAGDLRSFTSGSYVIVFRPVDDGVEVVRIVHGARDFTALF
jgi:toxin ParE1/3/4